MDDGGAAETGLLTRIRELPAGESPEDVMRALSQNAPAAWANRDEVMRHLNETLNANPDIEGIVGYSEGAAVAASLLVDEEEQFRKTGTPKRIKCAIFFTGWPPISSSNKLILSDNSDLTIDVPTLHVVGANGRFLRPISDKHNEKSDMLGVDPYRDGALGLYNVCNPDVAEIFDTGRGHTIPRGGPLVSELADAVREMISLTA